MGRAERRTSDLTPLAGAFRVTRTAGVLQTYIRGTGSEWVPVNSGVTTGAAVVLAPQLYTPASEFQQRTGRVAFDDFRLDSGELTCPTWWSDSSADV